MISTSTHRLQTISLTQALSQQSIQSARISTGSRKLDALLRGGILKGQVAEICGPPGAGKSNFLLQLAISALVSDQKVLWISCTSPPRFPDPLNLDAITHIYTPTLSHLLSLLLHSSLPTFSLLLLDDVSALFTAAFPPGAHSVRKAPLLLAVVTELGRIAALRTAAVVCAVQMGTRVVKGFGAVLQSALSSPQWTGGVAVRLLVLRREGLGGREVRVVKVEGKEDEEGVARCTVAFEEGRWRDVDEEEEEGRQEEAERQQKTEVVEPLLCTPEAPTPSPEAPPQPQPSQSQPLYSQPPQSQPLPQALSQQSQPQAQPPQAQPPQPTISPPSQPSPPPPPAAQTTLKSPTLPTHSLHLPQKRKRSETTGIAAGIIPDSDDGSADEDEEVFGWGDDGIFEIGEKGAVVEDDDVGGVEDGAGFRSARAE